MDSFQTLHVGHLAFYMLNTDGKKKCIKSQFHYFSWFHFGAHVNMLEATHWLCQMLISHLAVVLYDLEIWCLFMWHRTDTFLCRCLCRIRIWICHGEENKKHQRTHRYLSFFKAVCADSGILVIFSVKNISRIHLERQEIQSPANSTCRYQGFTASPFWCQQVSMGTCFQLSAARSVLLRGNDSLPLLLTLSDLTCIFIFQSLELWKRLKCLISQKRHTFEYFKLSLTLGANLYSYV